jgi:ectoine hydroxylase-related dioxygenase (phytanoyl-CoA dioxygenase family)
MNTIAALQQKIAEDGFAITGPVFNNTALDKLLQVITKADKNKPAFRKTNDLFAIRQFLKELPAAANHIFCSKFNSLIEDIAGPGYVVVKSIYFDKPPASNWFVAFHQDLTIAVDKKQEIPGFGPWTLKENQFAVQPPLHLLEDNFTVRIHLDDTTEKNGALKVIPGSHRKGIIRTETANLSGSVTCVVPKGGIMFMKPLLQHASGRTTANKRRRVVHIEFSRQSLPEGLQWAEYFNYAESNSKA